MAQDCAPGERDWRSTLGSLSRARRCEECKEVTIDHPSETDRGSIDEGPHDGHRRRHLWGTIKGMTETSVISLHRRVGLIDWYIDKPILLGKVLSPVEEVEQCRVKSCLCIAIDSVSDNTRHGDSVLGTLSVSTITNISVSNDSECSRDPKLESSRIRNPCLRLAFAWRVNTVIVIWRLTIR